eukprot:5014829-Ditylum_brightwellii.AAC.1
MKSIDLSLWKSNRYQQKKNVRLSLTELIVSLLDCGADGKQDTNDRASEGTRLYSKAKKGPIPLAYIIFIIKGLLPAIKSAALTHKQSADEHEHTHVACGLMYMLVKFNDVYTEEDQTNMISLCHSPEARNILGKTLKLLEECMTMPFQGMGTECGLYIISALIKPE